MGCIEFNGMAQKFTKKLPETYSYPRANILEIESGLF